MIPVYKPWLTDLENVYAAKAVASTWISSQGEYIDRAEKLFADYIGAKHCILTSSGTTALHLCARALNLENTKGLILIPNTTFIATAFAVSYLGRKPTLVDIDPKTWNIDLDQVQELCESALVSAVIPVHLYGNPVDMARLKQMSARYGFKIVEDACESIDAKFNGKKTGTFGDISCFSFYGNKTFTCGEGGAVITDSDELASRTRLLRGQAQDPNRRYWHIDVGHNYRITNVQSAILCAQLERKDEILAAKARVAKTYNEILGNSNIVKFQETPFGGQHSNWLISVTTQKPYEEIAPRMAEFGIETRRIFYPINTMPMYAKGYFHNSAYLAKYGISLPSYPQLTDDEIVQICSALVKCCG